MMRTILHTPAARLALALAVPAVLAACGDGAGPSDDVEGTYALAAVNGESPPALVLDTVKEGSRLRVAVVDGELVLAAGEYTSELEVGVTLDGDTVPTEPLRDSGSYEADEETIRFTSSRTGSVGTAARADGEITVSETDPEWGELTLVYRR